MIYIFLLKLYKLKFLKRFVPSLLRIIGGSIVVNILNFKVKCLLKDSIDREIFLTGFYDKDRLEYLNNFTDKYKFDYFFDIGAYIGFYSLYFSKNKLIPNVLSFEPNLTNYNKLTKNIMLNNSNIQSFNFALSDRIGQGEIWYSDQNKMGGSSIKNDVDNQIKIYNMNNIFFKNVKLSTLDKLYGNLSEKLILIKIDVERHELNVLNGGAKFFTQNKILLQIEIMNDYKKSVFDKLNKYNFNLIYSIDDDYFFSNFIKI